MATVVSADWVLPVEGIPIRDGAVSFEDGRIVAVGPSAGSGAGTRYEGAAIIPGFVNAHTHLEYAVYGGFGDGLPFEEWIGIHIRRKSLLTEDDHLAIARVGALASLASGVTTIGDASYSGAAAQAAAEARPPRDRLPGDLRQRPGEGASALRGTARSSRGPCLQPRPPRRVAPCALHRLGGGLRGRRGARTACDDAPPQTEDERAWVERGAGTWAESMGDKLVAPAGKSGIRMLAERGLIAPGLTAVHCVDLEPDRLDLLVDAGAGVVHCPRSNGYLGCGSAPLRALLDAGAHVGLGTDSPNSAVDFDLFAELRAAVMQARARERDAEALSASEALELATLGGARALRLDGEIGSLVPGKHADLAVVALADTGLYPWEDPASAVVLGGSPEHVQATLVGGEVRYERGKVEWQRRSSQRSRRRTKANARRRVRGTAGVSTQEVEAQEQMFFMRLRNHAVWVFVALAIIFGFSFVVTGVGSSGAGDVLSGLPGIFQSSEPNAVKTAEDKVEKAEKAKDNAALATALLPDRRRAHGAR